MKMKYYGFVKTYLVCTQTVGGNTEDVRLPLRFNP